MTEIDIRDTYQSVVMAQVAALSDRSSMSETGINLAVYLGQLHHMIQAVEVNFTEYQIIRCDAAFDPDKFEVYLYEQIVHQPYRNLSERINDLAAVDPTDPLIATMRIFGNFRNWVAHKMTAAFAPVLHNEQLAKGIVPLAVAMMNYATGVTAQVNQAIIDFMKSHFPKTNDSFTEESVNEFSKYMADICSRIVPSRIDIPTGVTNALWSTGLWPYAKPPGNDGAILGLDDEGKFARLRRSTKHP